MNCIGSVIKEYRKRKKISRKSLADGLCSEKYIYLIEKGERTPSAEMSALLGDKLGIDLFEYYEYVDCIDPIDVNQAIKLFTRYRNGNDMVALKRVTDEAMQLPDFQNKPWKYEIDINQMAYMALKQGKYRQAIKRIEELVQKVDEKHANGIYIANLYLLLSTCYQMGSDLERAKEAISQASQVTKGKERIMKYTHVVISIQINKITMYYLGQDFDGTIREGLSARQYQIEMSQYERLHHTLYYLAFAYYDKGMTDEAAFWFIKAMCVSLASYKPMDMFYLSSYPAFEGLLNEPRVSGEMVDALKCKYDLQDKFKRDKKDK